MLLVQFNKVVMYLFTAIILYVSNFLISNHLVSIIACQNFYLIITSFMQEPCLLGQSKSINTLGLLEQPNMSINGPGPVLMIPHVGSTQSNRTLITSSPCVGLDDVRTSVDDTSWMSMCRPHGDNYINTKILLFLFNHVRTS